VKKTLVIFAHPYLEYSTTNAELIKIYKQFEHVELKDLYEEYEDFHISTFRERKRIREYQRLIFHFPLIWFSVPPLLKLWIDEVFDMSWKAESDHPLRNKDAAIIVTAGASEQNFQPDGIYSTTIEELMKPLVLSLDVNGIEVKNLLAVYDADDLQPAALAPVADQIIKILESS